MVKGTAQFLHGEFERNWACHEDPYYAQRRRNINEMTTTSHRVVEGKMLTIARRFPKATSAFLQRSVDETSKYELAGAGSVHTVLKDGAYVYKVHRLSSFLDIMPQISLLESFKSEHSILRKYLGQIALPQSSYVGINPLQRKKTAVVSIQSQVSFNDLGLFNGYTAEVNEEKLEIAKQAYPGIDSALKDLAVAGLSMYEETGRLPDTSGLNNIVVSRGELLCLDGIPFNTTKQSDVQRITGQLTALQQMA